MPYSGLSVWFRDEEETLFKNLGRELVEDLITQHYTLYRIDLVETESNFYGEAKTKIFKDSVEVLARIQIIDADIISEGGVRRMSKGDMSSFVYNDHLTELGVEIHVGDFIAYEGKYYEVYDPGYNKDAINRKFASDRDYYQEILAKVVDEKVFKAVEG